MRLPLLSLLIVAVSTVYPSDREQRGSVRTIQSPLVEATDTSVTRGVASPRGFSTSFGRTESKSSLSGYSALNYDSWVGFGYNISPDILAEMRIYTGSETTTPAHIQPVTGKFDYGGGALLLTYRFFHGASLRPFLTGGYELATILTSASKPILSVPGTGSSGYNGRGLQLYAGLEYYISEYVSLEGNTAYRRLEYFDLIVNGTNLGHRAVLIDDSFGISVGCNIHFNFVP